jgi:alkanesulfonate monooxygenase SsuD/methylene tetrahydromethanopterin reductase-like flavin-dependent oxidoreductase (luciferase family)
MSPEPAVELLRAYRRDFAPGGWAPRPWSAMSVLTFAADDPRDVAEFEAGWALTIANLRRGVREPVRPEQVRELATSETFRLQRDHDGRMVTGPPTQVVKRLRELAEQAQVDELVVVTPSIDRARRAASLSALAEAWTS